MNEPRPHTEAELIELVRRSEVKAPDALHRRIESLIVERSTSRARRGIFASTFGAGGAPLRRLAPAAAFLAVAAVVLAVVLGGGGGRSLSLDDASALTLSPATAPAPQESSRHRSELVAAVQDVHFPYWEDLGWRSTGQRTDSVGGRVVTTIFYANRSGRRIGYAIVSGTPAPWVGRGAVQWRDGTSYRLFTRQGVEVVTWLRDGRLCVLSGRGVDRATLVHLASWGQRGAVA